MEESKQAIGTLGILQARMGSTRFPGKSMEDIQGKPALLHIIDRLKESKLDNFIVATTNNKIDDVIEKLCNKHNVGVFRGSEDDVLDRFYQVAKLFRPKYIVRIMGDQIFLDPLVVNKFIDNMKNVKDNVDFIGNKGFPEGQNIDIFKYETLDRAWREATNKSDREHVCPYIYQNPDKFIVKYIKNQYGDMTSERWVLDKQEDLRFLREISFGLYKKNPNFGMKEIIEYLIKNPHLKLINNNTKTKEGYIKSLNLDNGLYLNDEYKQAFSNTIAMSSNTMSKAYYYYPEGFTPIAVSYACDSTIYSIEGVPYLDFVSGLGSNLLGYCNPKIAEAIRSGTMLGINFSLPHYMEVELADEIIDIFNGVEKVKFGKNGSDMTSAAIRAARIFTNKEHIAYCGYHGSQDWNCADMSRNAGIPKCLRKLIHQFKWNDINSLKEIFDKTKDKIAAVIFEIPYEEPKKGFLEKIKKLAHERGAIVILDEVVTGLRWSLGGAAEYYNFTPDLLVCGKALGNGMPLSILGGRKDIMDVFDKHGFYSFTFAGEILSISAALKTIELLKKNKVHEHIAKVGDIFIDGVKNLSKKHKLNIKVKGNHFRAGLDILDWDKKPNNKLRTLFMQEMLKNKILCRDAPWFFSYAHKVSEIKKTLKVMDEVFLTIKKCYEQKSTDGYLKTYEITSPFIRK